MALIIKKVTVLGAGGSVGKAAIKALLADAGRFEVTGVSRKSSNTKLPRDAAQVTTDYSLQSLTEIFQGQDAIVSTLSGEGLQEQVTIIDAALAAGVKVFVPSEYGIDTELPAAPEVIPFIKAKVAALDYLRSKQDQISWIAVVCGSLLDWGFYIPGFGGWNLPAKTVTIYDGGDVKYEATTLDQVGRAIAAAFDHIELTANKHIYINSFTTTQNQILATLEAIMQQKFATSAGSSEQMWQDGTAQLNAGNLSGLFGQVAAAFYGKGAKLDLCTYSKTRSLLNDKLGLPKEDLKAVLQEVVQQLSSSVTE